MLRTTVSRIKKVCVVAFVPRLLRGDQRCCTASKFEIFSSAVLKKAQKSTKTTDDDDETQDCSKCVSEQESSKLQKTKNKCEDELNTAEEILDENNPSLENISPVPLRETACQKCQRIIDQAFGKDENFEEPVLGEQYFSHNVNIEETRQEIEKAEIAKLKFIREKNLDRPVPDDRVQFGVYQSRELSEQPLVDSDDLMLNQSMIKMSDNIEDVNKGTDLLEDFKHESVNIHVITQGACCDLSEKSDCLRQIEAIEIQYSEQKHNPKYIFKPGVKEIAANENKSIFDDENLPLNEILAQEEKFIREQEMKEEATLDDLENIQPLEPMQHIQHIQHNHTHPIQHIQHMQHMRHMQHMCEKSANAKFDCYGMPVEEDENYHSLLHRSPVYNYEYKTNLNKVPDSDDTAHLKPDIASKESVKLYVNNQEKMEKKLESDIRNSDMKSSKILNATTASENEEQLTQKLETIEETPLVEAHKPKLEGFNVTPRILGEAAQNVSCTATDKSRDGASNVDAPSRLDEVAKRCLDTPSGNIDEILLKEMEKLGIPITGNRSSQGGSKLLDHDLVQMDVLKKQRKNPTDTKDFDLESHRRGAIELTSAQMLYPSRCMFNEHILPDTDADDIEGSDPNQVLNDPCDKKIIGYENDEYDPSNNYDPNKKFSYYYVPHANQETDAISYPLDRPTDDTKSIMEKLKMTSTQNVSNVKDDQINAEQDENISSFDILDNMDQYATGRRGANPDLEDAEAAFIAETDPQEVKQSHNLQREKMFKSYADTVIDTTEELDPHPEIKSSKNTYTPKLEQITMFNPFKINELDNTRNERLDPHPEIQNSQNAYASKLDRAIIFNPYSKVESDYSDDLEIQRTQNAKIAETKSEALNNTAIDEEEHIETYSEQIDSVNVYATDIDETIDHSIDNIHSEEHEGVQYFDSVCEELDPQAEMDYNRFVNTTGIGKSAPMDSLKVTELYDILDNEPLESHPEINHAMYIYAADTNKACAVDIDKACAADPYNINDATCTWGEDKLDPHPEINHLLYLHNAPLYIPSYMNETKPKISTSKMRKNKVLNRRTRRNTNPWDKTVFASKPVEEESYKKLSENGTDEVWDTCLPSRIKSERKAVKVDTANDLYQEQLDDNYVLAFNETSPPAPKPQVCACETSRLIDTEDIFDKEFTKAESEAIGLMDYSNFLSDLERGSHNDEPKQKSKRLNTNKVQHSDSVDPSAPGGGTGPGCMSASMSVMPKLNENVKLSELLRRVRERSRILECRNELKSLGVEIEPAQGKCPRKAPKCPPTAPRSPPSNPVPPPSFGLPPLKPRPRACKPPKRKPTNKCSSCNMDELPGLLIQPTIKGQTPVACPEMVCEMNDVGTAGVATLTTTKSVADLTDDVIDHLQSIGKKLGGAISKGKAEVLEAGCVMKSGRICKILMARDYEPWAPIPSWPTPKKDEPKKPQCSPGCRIFPPPRSSHDPPCEEKGNPCTGFPKRTFSLLDCFAVSLGDNKVYDIGDF